MLQLWFIGSEEQKVPPLRQLELGDVQGFLQDGGKRLNDMKVLCGKFVEVAKAEGVYVDRPTPEEVSKVFRHCLPALGVPDKTPKGRKRNLFTCKWTQLLKLYREELKKVTGGGGRRRRRRTLTDEGKAAREEERRKGLLPNSNVSLRRIMMGRQRIEREARERVEEARERAEENLRRAQEDAVEGVARAAFRYRKCF